MTSSVWWVLVLLGLCPIALAPAKSATDPFVERISNVPGGTMTELVLDAHRQRNFDLVLRVFAAVSAGDADAQITNYTEDIALEFPYTDPPTVVSGRTAVHERLKSAFKAFQIDLTIGEVHHGLDPDELIIEFTGAGSYLPNNAPYVNRYIAVFGFRDGLIYRQREYFDPTQAGKSANA